MNRVNTRLELWRLFDLSQAGWAESLGEGLTALLQSLCELLQAQGASVFLRDAATDTYTLEAQWGADAKIPSNAKVSAGIGIAGACILSGTPMLVDDPSQHPLIRGRVDKRTDVVSSIIVPLLDESGFCQGVMSLRRGRQQEPFEAEDLDWAAVLGHHMALAVSNVKLISARNKAQSEAARLSRLAEIGQMTAAIAHDIRNPLTGILSAAQMIKMLGGESTEFAEIIEEEAKKLNALCSDFLDFAKPMTVDKEEIVLNELLGDIVAAHRHDAISAKVELIVTQGKRRTVKADRSRVEQVAHNLVLNAIQASPTESKVILTSVDGGFSVTDKGLGMTPEHQKQLFTPFFTTKPKGTGLGLSTVRKIVDAHGGVVEVKSKLGHGTTFTVLFEGRRIA